MNHSMTTNAPGVHVGGIPVLIKRLENTLLIGIPLLGSVLAIFHIANYGVSFTQAATLIISLIVIGLGITVGLHRLFTHKAFKAHTAIKILLAAIGTMAFQGSIRRWVADHRRHHAHTDESGDLHSPHIDPWGENIEGARGFFHAHIGWMFDNTTTDMEFYGKGLMEDKIIRFFSKTHAFWLFLSLGIPYLIGYIVGGHNEAWGCLLIGGCLRTAILHQTTWSVNSFGHVAGNQHYNSSNESRNSMLLALLTMGEGWHNNHHQYPRSYKQGLYKGEYDPSARVIEWLESKGLARDIIDNSGVKRGEKRFD